MKTLLKFLTAISLTGATTFSVVACGSPLKNETTKPILPEWPKNTNPILPEWPEIISWNNKSLKLTAGKEFIINDLPYGIALKTSDHSVVQIERLSASRAKLIAVGVGKTTIYLDPSYGEKKYKEIIVK